jgi:cell division protein FtsB
VEGSCKMKIIILVLASTMLSGCWYYYEEQEAYLEGYQDCKAEGNEELEALEEENAKLREELALLECESWCDEQIAEICGQ